MLTWDADTHVNVGVSDWPVALCVGDVSATFPGRPVESFKVSARVSFNTPLIPDTCKR